MREVCAVVGGVLVALGMAVVVAAGLCWDEAEYERRQEQRRRSEKERADGDTD